MRVLLCCCWVVLCLTSCDQEGEETCPDIWGFDKKQVSASAVSDSSELVLEIWNPVSPNAITLTQTSIEDDFEISISLNEMTSDTLLVPQFRMEVTTGSGADQTVSGIAVNPKAYFCYVEEEYPENGDMRFINNPEGTMTISRLADTLTCSAEIGGVSFAYAGVLANTEHSVRLVFGSANSGNGRVSVRLDDFEVRQAGEGSSDGVLTDYFECRSW